MILNERQQKIFDILKKEKSISVKSLLNRLFVSDSTLRRDLTLMQNQGIIYRTHGHAMLLDPTSSESSILVRVKTRVKEKNAIAIACSKLLANDDSYFIDSSSTAGYVLPHLEQYQNVTVVTNGLNNAAILTNTPNVKVYLPGGIIYSNTNSVLGIDTSDYIKRFNCNAFIFSCGGISLKAGVTEVSLEQALIKREMLHQSKTHILLVDSSKFDKTYLCQTANFEALNYIVTDKMPTKAYRDAFEQANVKLIIAS
jgi:DeoR family fructose operon transcriptional repressor